jgi:hypothetical protein
MEFFLGSSFNDTDGTSTQTARRDPGALKGGRFNLMESLDSGHTTVKTESSQPGLSQGVHKGQDPSSRVLLRSTR